MATLAEIILELTAERGAGKSICPTEAARAAASKPEDWRKVLPHVRAAAVNLAREGQLLILRKGKPVDPEDFKGVYRLAVNPDAPAPLLEEDE